MRRIRYNKNAGLIKTGRRKEKVLMKRILVLALALIIFAALLKAAFSVFVTYRVT